MICKKCGTKNLDEYNYCINCKNKLVLHKITLFRKIVAISIIIIILFLLFILIGNYFKTGMYDDENNIIEEIIVERTVTDFDINKTKWFDENNNYIIFQNYNFTWYEDKNNLNDNFKFGKYTECRDDLNYNFIIDQKTEIDYDKQILDKYIDENLSEYNQESFSCFHLSTFQQKTNGIYKIISNPYSVYYFGYVLIDGEQIRIINLNGEDFTLYKEE